MCSIYQHLSEFPFESGNASVSHADEPAEANFAKYPTLNRTGDGAIYMALEGVPSSYEAIALVGALADQACAALDGKYRPTAPFREALAAIIGDIAFARQQRSDALCYRTFGNETFEGCAVGSVAFRKAIDGLVRLGLVSIDLGSRVPFNGQAIGVWATRVRPLPALLDRLDGVGILAWNDHFTLRPRPKMIKSPLILRKSAERDECGRKLRGEGLPVDLSKEPAASLAAQVNRINAFFADQVVDSDLPHRAFIRVFNMADDPAFAFNKGGRLISVGHSYQQMPAADRKAIKLNGEAVVELDIKASHATILHALMGIPRPPDPYEVPGVPRQIAKQWFTMVIGHGGINRCWSREASRKYKKDTGKNITEVHPFKIVSSIMSSKMTIMMEWLKNPLITWADLQFLESEAIIDTVEELALNFNVAALPVHDSIIVPRSQESLARGVLEKNFKRYVGAVPELSAS